MNKLFFSGALLGALVAGVGAGAWFFSPAPLTGGGVSTNKDESAAASEKEPLYWVAPMDDSYRRDKPGKSPMGMDLVPVYAEDQGSEPGDVQIAPTVQHNLGLKLGEVSRGPFHRPVSTTGYVVANQDRLKHYHVRAQGWISELSVATEGDPVKAGQKLFEFYSPEIVNIQKEYLQALREQRPALARSSIASLRAKGVSDREIKRLQETGEIRQRLHYYADRDGYVFNLGVREGNFVDLPQNLMSLGSLEDIWVTLEFFEHQAGLLETGQPVTLTADAYPGREWSGQVDYLYPTLNENQRTLRARSVFPNEDGRLKPGMYVEARVHTQPREAVLTAPASAVIRTGAGARVVLKVGPERFRSVPVKLGHRAGDRVEILAGLDAGDQVVVDGQFLIDSESSREADLSRFETAPNPSDDATPSKDHDAMGHGDRDHGDMEHDEMDHEGMDHGDMNHESMNHDGMDHDDMTGGDQ
ncbi:efflux RND transporter periplasmic adaptor subunit [Marinimicrobium agarilyticum]|uniref:efflux RND transporter periplasmic adaptor subunit n=1 Tax=Marinimicrobium agarilyticum TaxID=306546 RepID=UPI00042260A1|nr:efflux RND transporter periplasmic adaptor subunit [Marinimicrobium agarilyticum]